jgi:Flp pilus assembly protein TadG
VTGTTHLATPNADLALGPGKLTATTDLNTDAITATLKLPNATGSFNELGLVPVTATAQLINNGPTTGTVDPNTGTVTTTSLITMKIVSLSVLGIPQPVGNSCQTSTPVSVTVTSQPGFSILKGGNLAGTYTIPPFANCGLETLLINLTLPGPNNTITLTLGKGKFVP